MKKKRKSRKWEFTKLYCVELHLAFDEKGEQIEDFYAQPPRKKVSNPVRLDPEISLPKNALVVWPLAWSEKNKHYTQDTKVLNQLGEVGWGVTGLKITSSNDYNLYDTYNSSIPKTTIISNEFYLLMKRPKV